LSKAQYRKGIYRNNDITNTVSVMFIDDPPEMIIHIEHMNIFSYVTIGLLLCQ